MSKSIVCGLDFDSTIELITSVWNNLSRLSGGVYLARNECNDFIQWP